MRYINKLQDNNARKLSAIAETYNTICDFQSYLLSPKFHSDPTIQVQDVMNYLEKMRSILLESID